MKQMRRTIVTATFLVLGSGWALAQGGAVPLTGDVSITMPCRATPSTVLHMRRGQMLAVTDVLVSNITGLAQQVIVWSGAPPDENDTDRVGLVLAVPTGGGMVQQSFRSPVLFRQEDGELQVACAPGPGGSLSLFLTITGQVRNARAS